jgi:hypothetical protein
MSDRYERTQRYWRWYRQGAEDLLAEDILKYQQIFCDAAFGRLFGLLTD